MTLNLNAQAGDETRRNGDYIGLPHPNTSEVTLDNVTVPKGKVVTYDGSSIAEVAGSDNDTVAGVVYEYDVFGDSNDGPLVKPDRDATIKTRGAVVADLSAYVSNGSGTTVAEGNALGPNGEILVVEEVENGSDLFEVLVR